MAKGPDDQPSEGADPLARPLPSVDIPLLRGQVRAERAKRNAVLGLLAFAGLALLAWWAVGALRGGPDEPEALALPPPVEGPEEGEDDEVYLGDGLEATAEEEVRAAEPPPPEPEVQEVEGDRRRFEATFGRAIGFRPALRAAGLSEEECVSIEQALTGTLDFRRCHPSDTIVYERDASDVLQRLRYQQEQTSYVEVVRGENGALSASRVTRPVESTPVVRGGRVRSSLGDAVESAGLGRTLVGVFVEVFDGKVNFATQARAGDQFRVVVDEEKLDGAFLRWGQVRAIEYVGERAGTLRAFWFEERPGRGDWYGDDGRQIRGGWLRVPCRYDRMSSPFNPRRMHPILRRIVPHNGVDFAASTGTPVWAAADGTITWAGPKGPNGNLVSIRHADGYESHYAHLHRIQRGISPGVEVTQRQLIGAVGTTGRSTGPHLHFGVERNGRFVDPMAVINGPGRMLPAAALGRFRREMRELVTLMEGMDLGAAPRPAAPEPEPEPEGEVLD
ncbi:MAG: M23 family metallopeptidase [Sandaracinus sp.]|nr:M23 family metallopeptidase [Sandaracinus sp.]MCB9618936.1 M23 family metallopeptidase [Sandaracinus sp.]